MVEEAAREKSRLLLLEEVTKLNNAGSIALKDDRLRDARHYYEDAMAKLIEGCDGKPEGDTEAGAASVALTNLGHIASKVNNYNKSIEYYKKALQLLYHIHGDETVCEDSYVADVLNTIGALYVQKQQQKMDIEGNKPTAIKDEINYKKAEEHFTNALEIYRRAFGPNGKSFGMAQALCNLGNLSFLSDHTKDAESYYKRSLATYSRANELNSYVPREISEAMSSLLNNLGSLSRQRKEYEDALDYFKQALSFEYMTYGGDCKNCNVAATLSNCGHVSAKLGRLEDALRCYQRSLDTFPSSAYHKDAIAGVKIRMGTTSLHMKNISEAREHYQQAIQLYENRDPNIFYKTLQEADAWHCLGILERKMHNIVEAASHQEKALDALNGYVQARGASQSTQRLKNAIRSELINLDSCRSFNRMKNDVEKSQKNGNFNAQSRFRLWPGTGRTRRSTMQSL